MVRALLAAGVDPDPNPDSGAYTPLHRAVAFHREEVVELLLAAGAEPEHALLFFRPGKGGGPDSPLQTASPRSLRNCW